MRLGAGCRGFESRHSDQKTDADRQGGVGFSIGRVSNPERAKSVKKAAGGRFFSFLVRRRVPKCEAFGSSSGGDAQSAAPSRHSDHVGMDFAPFRFFFTEKSVTRAVIPPLSQKGTLGSPVRLQALTTAHCRYHLFVSCACGANTPTGWCRFFNWKGLEP